MLHISARGAIELQVGSPRSMGAEMMQFYCPSNNCIISAATLFYCSTIKYYCQVNWDRNAKEMGCIKNCSIVELYDNVLLKDVSKCENTFTLNCTFSGI